MKLFKDWVYAIKVCLKYRLIWNPFVKFGDGSYCWIDNSIHVNPLTKNFITIFMHEVGHHVHHRRVDLPSWLKCGGDELRFSGGDMEGWSVYKNLKAEAIASRYAMKSGKADKAFLLKAFHTYTSAIFKQTNKPVVLSEISTIVDSCYKNERLISK